MAWELHQQLATASSDGSRPDCAHGPDCGLYSTRSATLCNSGCCGREFRPCKSVVNWPPPFLHEACNQGHCLQHWYNTRACMTVSLIPSALARRVMSCTHGPSYLRTLSGRLLTSPACCVQIKECESHCDGTLVKAGDHLARDINDIVMERQTNLRYCAYLCCN